MSEPVKNVYGRDEPRTYAPMPDALRDTAADFKTAPDPSLSSFKEQAGDAAWDAKSTVAALAGEARDRIVEMVDQQKSVGADHVAGVARAAQAAAGDLAGTSPQLARLVKSAADSVDEVAESIRTSDLSDIMESLTAFGRRRPFAFFGGAVIAGFFIARFLKSDSHAL